MSESTASTAPSPGTGGGGEAAATAATAAAAAAAATTTTAAAAATTTTAAAAAAATPTCVTAMPVATAAIGSPTRGPNGGAAPAGVAPLGAAGTDGTEAAQLGQYMESMRQFTNFGAGQLNAQESQLINSMMMMNPYMMGLSPQLLASAMKPKIQLPSLRPGEPPILVNAKQYHRILKRRKHRATVSHANYVPKKRRAFLHESRHQHAMRRPRGPGGRFLRKDEIEALQQYERELSAKVDLDKAEGRDPAEAQAILDQAVAARTNGKISDALLAKAAKALERAMREVARAEAQLEADEARAAAEKQQADAVAAVPGAVAVATPATAVNAVTAVAGAAGGGGGSGGDAASAL